MVPNRALVDTEEDGAGNACDPDDDADGVLDLSDNCALTPNTPQLDTDDDGDGNACDDDDDDDAQLDGQDNCPLVDNVDQADADGDGVGDACEDDDDSDWFRDVFDNCQFLANTDQLDTDSDGEGNACDADDDDDGTADELDNCPVVANADQLDTDDDGAGNACDDDDDDDADPDVTDCAPLDPAVNSLAVEICDGLDNDCDEKVDEIGGSSCSAFGNGADGTLTVSGTVNLHENGHAAVFRVTTSVVSGATQILSADALTGLAVDDEVLVINLQGASTASADVGLHEFRLVTGIEGSTITVSPALDNSYDGTTQRIVVQRVPNYQGVVVSSGGLLTANAWDGQRFGVLAFRVLEGISVAAGGKVDVSRLGYRQGNGSQKQLFGQQGEGIAGLGVFIDSPNAGGGGGGISDEDGMGGGGGGYGTVGGEGANFGTGFTGPGGKGGLPYGSADLARLHFGGGGGECGADQYQPLLDNSGVGRGGGILWFTAKTMALEGQLLAQGQTGKFFSNSIYQRNSGSGAGGSVHVHVLTPSGAGTINATGGPAQSNGAGVGGVGRVRIDRTAGTPTPASAPAAFVTEL